MLRRTSFRMLQMTLLCSMALWIAAPDVVAQFVRGPRIGFCFYGVDSDGNLSEEHGGGGFARYYKFTQLNVIFGMGRARVTNDSGARATFRNLGLPVIDPETNEELTTTWDIYDVLRGRRSGRARVRAFGIYDGNANPT